MRKNVLIKWRNKGQLALELIFPLYMVAAVSIGFVFLSGAVVFQPESSLTPLAATTIPGLMYQNISGNMTINRDLLYAPDTDAAAAVMNRLKDFGLAGVPIRALAHAENVSATFQAAPDSTWAAVVFDDSSDFGAGGAASYTIRMMEYNGTYNPSQGMLMVPSADPDAINTSTLECRNGTVASLKSGYYEYDKCASSRYAVSGFLTLQRAVDASILQGRGVSVDPVESILPGPPTVVGMPLSSETAFPAE